MAKNKRELTKHKIEMLFLGRSAGEKSLRRHEAGEDMASKLLGHMEVLCSMLEEVRRELTTS